MAYGNIYADTLTNSNGSVGNAIGPGFKNRIINGAMMIDQRNAGASVTPTDGQYTLDRWQAKLSASSKYSVIRSATAPTGFNNSLLITSLSAYSISSSDAFSIRQPIEGFNVADLGWGTASAKTVTLSFVVRSSLTGTFGGSIFNSSANRSYPFSYTISSANTFETKSITIAGDTSGTWATDNNAGCYVVFGLGVGSTLSGTAGAWAGATYISATGATSVVGTNGATFYITGVQLEVGSSATSFDYRPYGTELALCQRYYEQITGSTTEQRTFGIALASSTTNARMVFYFKQQKRATPTIVGTSVRVSVGADGTSPTIYLPGPDASGVDYTTSGLTANYAYLIFNRSGSADYIAFSSEL